MKRKKPVVLIDVDGVIANFHQLYVDSARYVGVCPNSITDAWAPTTWDIGESMGLSRRDRALVWTRLKEHGVAANMLEYEGAVEGVKKIMNVADVYFPTASIHQSATWEFDRWHWFKRRFGEDVANRLIFTSQKHVVFGHMLVDDKPDNLKSWKDHWTTGAPILWPQPYNEVEKFNYHRPPTMSWDWLYRVAKGLDASATPRWIDS